MVTATVGVVKGRRLKTNQRLLLIRPESLRQAGWAITAASTTDSGFCRVLSVRAVRSGRAFSVRNLAYLRRRLTQPQPGCVLGLRTGASGALGDRGRIGPTPALRGLIE